MKNTAQPGPAATGFPTRPQAITLALAMMEHRFQDLIAIRKGDERWSDEDADVDNAIDLALAHTLRMKDMPFGDGKHFDLELFMVAAPINMGVRLFSRQDCHYFRALHSAAHLLQQLAAMVEFTDPL